MGWWKVAGFRSPNQPSDLWYFILPLLPAVINLIVGVEVSSLFLLTEFLVITLLIGFAEEAIFRGLMLNALKVHGVWRAVIITALLFGLSHSLNGWLEKIWRKPRRRFSIRLALSHLQPWGTDD